jgi:hypothetical protein
MTCWMENGSGINGSWSICFDTVNSHLVVPRVFGRNECAVDEFFLALRIEKEAFQFGLGLGALGWTMMTNPHLTPHPLLRNSRQPHAFQPSPAQPCPALSANFTGKRIESNQRFLHLHLSIYFKFSTTPDIPTTIDSLLCVSS